LNYHADGSLDIFVGNIAPGKDAATNWLPAPKGRFNLALRLYWPGRPILDGRWQPPVILKI